MFPELRFFKPEEFDHPARMDGDFLRQLDLARFYARVPFKINSDWREGSEAHMSGRCVDIRANTSYVKFRIVFGLMTAGINIIRLYSHHVHARFSSDDEQMLTQGGFSK